MGRTSHAATSSRKPDGQTNLGAEVCRQDGDRGYEQHAASETDAEALSQQCLPELGAQAEHHEPEYDAEATDEQEQA